MRTIPTILRVCGLSWRSSALMLAPGPTWCASASRTRAALCVVVVLAGVGDLVACQARLEGPAGGSPSGDAQAILNAHNSHRAKYCVPPLTWSADLASAAQQWARRCTFDPSSPDPNNPTKFVHSGVPGENLHWSWPPGQELASAAVDSWYKENRSYDFNKPGFSLATGHFTQLIWRASNQLGCAKATCGKYDLWVCRYSPAGNVTDQFRANVPPACR
jgi:hypothetical protein